jgi:phosphoribosylanthranilate isomerase
VQLHGSETPELARSLGCNVIRAVRARSFDDLRGLDAYGASAVLVDAYVDGRPGGTGARASWDLARRAAALGPVILAGGLGPENIADAIRAVHPYGVDVASGVEGSPGRKDHAKVREFVERARAASRLLAAAG